MTKSQLERWSADNPGTFSYTLEHGTNLMLASVWRTRGGWAIAAESDADAVTHAEEFGAWCVEDVSDGYYEDLGYEVWRVIDMPVEGCVYEVSSKVLLDVERVAASMEDVVCEHVGVWDLDKIMATGPCGSEIASCFARPTRRCWVSRMTCAPSCWPSSKAVRL